MEALDLFFLVVSVDVCILVVGAPLRKLSVDARGTRIATADKSVGLVYDPAGGWPAWLLRQRREAALDGPARRLVCSCLTEKRTAPSTSLRLLRGSAAIRTILSETGAIYVRCYMGRDIVRRSCYKRNLRIF